MWILPGWSQNGSSNNFLITTFRTAYAIASVFFHHSHTRIIQNCSIYIDKAMHVPKSLQEGRLQNCTTLLFVLGRYWAEIVQLYFL